MATKNKTAIETAAPARRSIDFTDQLIEPFTQLRTEVDRLFESFPFRMPALKLGRFAAAAPAIEMTETDKSYKITAELPGLEPEDVDVSVDNGILRITGEKKESREETERGFRLSERTYGSFERMISLPSAADPSQVDAKFKNGVLTVSVAKDRQASSARRIKVARG